MVYEEDFEEDVMEWPNEIYEKIASIIEEGLKPLDQLAIRVNQRIELLEMQLEEAQAKAAAYDRVMSHGLSMKELANVLKHPVAIENDDNQNTLYYFNSTPHIGQFSDGTQFWSCKRKWRLPRQLVNFYGDWKDSLTLPDGWEEK